MTADTAPTRQQLDEIVRTTGHAAHHLTWRGARTRGWVESVTDFQFATAIAARESALSAGWDAKISRTHDGKWKLSVGPRNGRSPVAQDDIDRTLDELEILGIDPDAYVRLRWHVIMTIADSRGADEVDPIIGLRAIECALIRAYLGAPEVRSSVFDGISRAVLAKLRGDSVDPVTLQQVT